MTMLFVVSPGAKMTVVGSVAPCTREGNTETVTPVVPAVSLAVPVPVDTVFMVFDVPPAWSFSVAR